MAIHDILIYSKGLGFMLKEVWKMWKKLLGSIFLVFMVLMNSGCVKVNVGIDIEKDKSMDFSYLMAVDTSVFQEE